ncbi:MAG: response regulator, partial [Limnobacter sp.]|nr:response regulator [Limnobacter sp.]
MSRVMVVEDEPIVLSNIAEILKFFGLDPICAFDGARAKELLLELSESREGPPSLIISDIMMPNMDGMALLDFVRSYEPTAHIPFLVLSAKSDSQDLRQAFSKGATEYLVKPFEVEDLIDTVRKTLETSAKPS